MMSHRVAVIGLIITLLVSFRVQAVLGGGF